MNLVDNRVNIDRSLFDQRLDSYSVLGLCDDRVDTDHWDY